MGKRGSTSGQAGREGDFAPPPSSACQKTAIFVSRRRVFPVVANLLELKFFLAYLSVAALAPSHRVVEPGEAFSPRETAAAPNKTQVFAGPILVPLGQRGGELSSSPFHEDTAPTGEQHFLQLFALLSLLLPPLPPSQAAYPHLPSLHSPSFLFLLWSESLAESAVLPSPLMVGVGVRRARSRWRGRGRGVPFARCYKTFRGCHAPLKEKLRFGPDNDG